MNRSLNSMLSIEAAAAELRELLVGRGLDRLDVEGGDDPGQSGMWAFARIVGG